MGGAEASEQCPAVSVVRRRFGRDGLDGDMLRRPTGTGAVQGAVIVFSRLVVARLAVFSAVCRLGWLCYRGYTSRYDDVMTPDCQ
jgi:hypothetical protein